MRTKRDLKLQIVSSPNWKKHCKKWPV